ncbi:hypothetical protein F4802DRAFT_553626 [Xylaria palmicola]|nr:hypothetical protein F4802DRAFT_553626 [Xylaria palmicola]
MYYGLLGPVLSGVLICSGAIAAAVIPFFLARRNRARMTDEERADTHIYVLGHINSNPFHPQGYITDMGHVSPDQQLNNAELESRW